MLRYINEYIIIIILLLLYNVYVWDVSALDLSVQPPPVTPSPVAQFFSQPPAASQSRVNRDDKPIGKTPRGSGMEYRDMPTKYHRRPIDQEEINYICVSFHWISN